MNAIRSMVLSGASLVVLALTLCVASGPLAQVAHAQKFATGSWDPSTTTCSCPDWYNGCNCYIQ